MLDYRRVHLRCCKISAHRRLIVPKFGGPYDRKKTRKKKRQKPKPTKPFGRRILSFWHVLNITTIIIANTVDGSEIRRSPVDMVNIPLFTGFHTSQVSLSSTLLLLSLWRWWWWRRPMSWQSLKIPLNKKILFLNHQSPNLPGTQSIGGSLGCYIPKFTQIECNAFLMSFRRIISIQLR